MKVLHIINSLAAGGAEKLIEELTPLLNESDNIKTDVLLLTDQDNVFADSVLKKGVNVDIIKYRNIYDPRNALEIKSYITKGSYNIVHSHIFPTQYWVALAKIIVKRQDIKFITTEHSTHNRRREKKYMRLLDQFVYHQYDAIISITERTRKNLLKWIDPKLKRTKNHVVIENGVNIQTIKKELPYRKEEMIDGILENTKLVCMVGSFTAAKDQKTLIKAVSQLSDDIHLMLVGEGPLKESNMNLVASLGISDRVHFLGFRNDVHKILKTVDIVVLSSHWEGLSLASIEGLSSGKPFIGSKVPGLEELVTGYGLVFNQGDVKKLKFLIDRLLTDNDYYQVISRRSFKRSKDYDIRNTLVKTLSLYNKILNKIEE